MYSQFCHYYQKFRQKKRATMHIPRKPGEQIEVDWAGNPVHLVDTDTGELIPCYIFIGALNYSLYAVSSQVKCTFFRHKVYINRTNF